MQLFTGFFRFIGINTFMAFLVFLMIDNKTTAYLCLGISISCFLLNLFFSLYKLYRVKKYREKAE